MNNEWILGLSFFLSHSVNKKNSLFLFTVYAVYLAVSFPTTGDDCDMLFSLSAFITLWMRIQREKWWVRDTFVRERRRRHHPKKNLKTCFNPITIETLKTKIVFFFRSLDTKKGTKVLILPSKRHTQCSDIYYYRFLTISSSNDDVLTIAFWFLRRVWLRGENTKSMA